MKMKKELLALGAVALLATSCSSQEFDNSKLVVGLECDYAPFNWTTTSESDYTLPIDGVSDSMRMAMISKSPNFSERL